MKLYLLHGPGITAMANKVLSIKKNYDPLNIKEFSGKEISFNEAFLVLSNLSLFAEDRLVILNDFSDVVLEKFSSDEHLTVIACFTKTLNVNSALLKEASRIGAQVIAFPEAAEISIFPFLDLLAEKDPRALRELDKVYSEYGGQYILTMLCYLLRRYVLPQTKLPGFVKQKLSKQQANFPPERLKSLYRDILETDFKIKTGVMEEKIGLSLLAEKFLSS